MKNAAIDFCLGWGPWPDEPFSDTVREHCRARKLSCMICKDAHVRKVIWGLEAGSMRMGFHLDLNAAYEEAGDPYARLAYAAKDSGTVVVNEPDHAKAAANKAVVHYQFERAGIPVPNTVVVRNWEPAGFKLTPAEQKRLGRPFIIKPARGYGKQGIAKANGGTVKEIARARRYDRGDDFLLQQFIEPVWFGYRMGWFRIFYILGEVIICWWDKETEHFACTSPDEFDKYNLLPLFEIMCRISRTVSMNFFSTELAIAGNGNKRRYVAIDYVNDPCDLTLQSDSHCGVPDRVVDHIAERLVEGAWRAKKKLDPPKGFSVWFCGT